ncbi:unnamed protein product [Caenorhabditis brenneri]
MISNCLIVFLLLNLALPVFGISCYAIRGYDNLQTVVHNKSFCTAYYEVANGEGTFYGVDRDPIKTDQLKWDFNLGKDCQLQKHRLNEKEEMVVVYQCICFTQMCNFPFSYKEFEARGFTLAPKPSKVDSIW